MASPAVIAAFEAKLTAEWSACPIVPENALGETPADGAAFLLVHYPFVTREQISIGAPGNNTFRETGAARFVLAVKSGAGLDQARDWMDQLVRMFVGKDIGGVIIRDVDGPITDGRNDDGNYFRLALAVAYEFDFTA